MRGTWLPQAIWLAVIGIAAAQFSDKPIPFNDTFQFTLTSIEPMMQFDARPGEWSLDETTGYRKTAGTKGQASLHFVGTGFEVRGSLQWDESQTQTTNRSQAPVRLVLRYEHSNSTDSNWSYEPYLTGRPHLATLAPFELDAYKLDFDFRNGSAAEFHNITIDLPVRTQARSLQELETQSTFLNVTGEGMLDPRLRIGNTSKLEELRQMAVDVRGAYLDDASEYGAAWPFVKEFAALNQTHDIVDGALVLQNFTELSYTLPPNTTLVRVLGPVKQDESWKELAVCWAALEPKPSWWFPSNFPTSRSFKEQNAENQTMFILPINPTIQTTLKIGSGLRANQSCRLSGIQTYPFHYNYTLADMVAHEKAAAAPNNDTQSTPNGTEIGSSKETTHSKSNKTPIIVGVVVGVGGALLLGGLLAWCFLRRRKQRKGRETEEKDNALVASDGASTPTGDASSSNSGDDHGRLPARAAAPAHLSGPPPSYGRRSIDDPSQSRRPPTPGATAALNGAEGLEQPRRPQPALKAEYARVFDPNTSDYDTSSPPLKQEYKRAFGPRPLQLAPAAALQPSPRENAQSGVPPTLLDEHRPAFRLSTEL